LLLQLGESLLRLFESHVQLRDTQRPLPDFHVDVRDTELLCSVTCAKLREMCSRTSVMRIHLGELRTLLGNKASFRMVLALVALVGLACDNR
jgi:hypothetical protein